MVSRRSKGRSGKGPRGSGPKDSPESAKPDGPAAEEQAATDRSADPEGILTGEAGMPGLDEFVAGGDEASGGAMHIDEMQELAAELEEVRDRHLRLAAEFDNFRKRTIRERSLHAERAQAELVKELLESLDDLTRVLGMGATAKDNESLLEGVRLVERKLRRALEHSGLKQIEAVGQPFDPELHEALSVVPVDEPQEDGVVADELSKGYLFRDTLLKPALVNVKKYQPKGEGEEGGKSAHLEEDS